MLAGHKYLFGDKLTVADFYLASLMYSSVYNSNLGMGEAWSSEGKKIVESNAAFGKLVATYGQEFSQYFATRPAAPC